MNGKDLVKGIVSSFIVATFFFFLPSVAKSPYRWLIVVLLVTVANLTWLFFILFRWIFRLRKIGIKNVVLSMTRGQGSTKSILQTVVHQFSFMGIAAKKWIDKEEDLETVMKKIGGFMRSEPLRFLLLDPGSNVAKNISKTQYHGDETKIPKLIQDSIDYLKKMRKERDHKIELKLYSFQPIFRIAIVNNNKAYVGFYRGDAKEGKDSPQLILDLDKQQEISYFLPFREYYKEIWENRSEAYNLEDD